MMSESSTLSHYRNISIWQLFLAAICFSANAHSGSGLLKLSGVPLIIETGIARDTNGNGYVDAIILSANQPCTLVTDLALNATSVSFRSFSWAPLTIVSEYQYDTYFKCIISELSTPFPQTSWTPTFLSHDIFVLNYPDSTINLDCIDGAGPVLWSATKHVLNAADNRQDSVAVYFSEPIKFSQPISQVPACSLFAVWQRDGDNYFRQDSALCGISSLSLLQGDSIVSFKMQDGFDLAPDLYFSIRTIPWPVVSDLSGNVPSAKNHLIRIASIGGANSALTASASNFKPTTDHLSEFLGIISTDSVQSIVTHRGGVLVRAHILLSADQACILNTLTWRFTNDNLLAPASFEFPISLSTESSGSFLPNESKDFFFFWNGCDPNLSKMPDGDYSAILTVDYYDSKDIQTATLSCDLHIGDSSASNSGCGGCGTGVGMAFFPPLGFWLRTRILKAFKKRTDR